MDQFSFNSIKRALTVDYKENQCVENEGKSFLEKRLPQTGRFYNGSIFDHIRKGNSSRKEALIVDNQEKRCVENDDESFLEKRLHCSLN